MPCCGRLDPFSHVAGASYWETWYGDDQRLGDLRIPFNAEAYFLDWWYEDAPTPLARPFIITSVLCSLDCLYIT